MPIPCRAIVLICEHGNVALERHAHVGILLYFRNAFQHTPFPEFQGLSDSQDPSSACPLHSAIAFVLGARPSAVQLRLVPKGTPHDGDEHPARNRDRMGLHLLEPRQNFRGREIFHRVGPTMVRFHVVFREPDVLWGAKGCNSASAKRKGDAGSSPA